MVLLGGGGWGERREPGVGGTGEVAREQKKKTKQVYDKNVFATIDNLKKTLYHM